MARIARSATSETFNGLTSASYAKNENNDCAVKALAVVCNLSYDAAHSELKALGRQDRSGTRIVLIHKAIEAHGFKLEHVSPKRFIAQYPAGHRDVLKSVTSHHPERFNSVWADGCTYLMYVSGYRHVLAVVDGVNHDWSKGSAKRAIAIYKITK